MTLIPGYLATVTLNAEDVTAIGGVYRLNLNRTVNTKNLAGSKWAGALGGQQHFTFSAQGSLSAEKAAALNAAAIDTGRIAFSLQVGEAAGATDAGVYNGTGEISNFTIDGNADGEFDWSLDLQSDGAVVYTPVAGS